MNYAPVLERLVTIARAVTETADLLTLFHTRLAGGPSINTPPPRLEPDAASLPGGMDELFTFIENVQYANHAALQAIAGRF